MKIPPSLEGDAKGNASSSKAELCIENWNGYWSISLYNLKLAWSPSQKEVNWTYWNQLACKQYHLQYDVQFFEHDPIQEGLFINLSGQLCWKPNQCRLCVEWPSQGPHPKPTHVKKPPPWFACDSTEAPVFNVPDKEVTDLQIWLILVEQGKNIVRAVYVPDKRSCRLMQTIGSRMLEIIYQATGHARLMQAERVGETLQVQVMVLRLVQAVDKGISSNLSTQQAC